MTDCDRYDFAMMALFDLIMLGAFLLGAPLWIAPLFLMLAITISAYRHFDLPPRRR